MKKLLNVALLLALVQAFNIVHAKENEQAKHATREAAATSKAIPAKAWTHANAKMLDLFLRSNPTTLYRIYASGHAIQKLMTALKTATPSNMKASEEAAFVTVQLQEALKFVAPFIDDIRDFKEIITPLLAESMAYHKTTQNILGSFLAGKQSLSEFTQREVQSVKKLQDLLQEFHGFFGDLIKSLTPETKAAYQKFVAAHTSPPAA